MEQTSRKEAYRRKRSHSARRTKRRLVTSAFVVAFFALAVILWLSYNGSGDKAAKPAAPDAKQGTGQTADPPAGKNGEDGKNGAKGTAGNATPPADPPKTQPGKPDDRNDADNNGSGNPPGTANGQPDASGGGKAPSGTAGGSPGGSAPVGGQPGSSGGGSAPAASWLGSAEWSKEADDPSKVLLTFVGDVIFADNVAAALNANGFDYPYRQVSSYLEKADLTIANLETPITERGTKQIKEYAYRSSPKALPAFKEAGFDLVNLANNHILDYGTVGLLDTFDHLDKQGIGWFGAGRNTSQAFKPLVVEKKGIKIAFLGLSKVVPLPEWKAGNNRPGVADTYALKVPLEAIAEAKKQADLVVVVAHWGVEQQDQPEKYQKEFAREYIDAGADLVVGGHPHVLQGFEKYKDKWIAYSLGNFIFTMNSNPVTWETIILQASCSKEGGCLLKAVPVLSKLANPEPMDEEAGARLFRRLNGISFDTELDRDGILRAK
ncbi:CapA family protein [Paenibacillus hodogayensis]|uniref:CapA family protein n=1 Tax=Paenibacillus hodogayensis TaxID=279208 RepID=A0ABV5VXH2_9BACL